MENKKLGALRDRDLDNHVCSAPFQVGKRASLRLRWTDARSVHVNRDRKEKDAANGDVFDLDLSELSDMTTFTTAGMEYQEKKGP